MSKEKLTGKEIKKPNYHYTGQKEHVVEQPKPTPELGWKERGKKK